MPRPFPILAGAVMALCCSLGWTHEPRPSAPVPVPESLRVYGELTPLAGVADVKFREFFKMPYGPRGLELSDKLRQLDRRTVRLVGYMARQDDPSAGMFILSPLPVQMGDADDAFADDLPASAVFVRLAAAERALKLPFMPGLMALTGTLEVGPVEEADGRVSTVRLVLIEAQSRSLAEALPPQARADASTHR